jgi:hypothetical protein
MDISIPKVGKSLDEVLVNPSTHTPEPTMNINHQRVTPKVDTSHIDKNIESVSKQLEQIKNQPKLKTKTQIDDELRSLDINDAYLSSSRQKGKILNDEYFRKIQENEVKRESLLKENKAYTHDVPDELKVMWNKR